MENSRGIRPEVCSYMFGYYALQCHRSIAFWDGIRRDSPAWSVFNRFVKQMETYSARTPDPTRRRRDLVAAAAAHEVTNLRVFGSVARGEDRADSDVDLLVELPPHMGLLGLGRVQAELEAILGTTVDLVPASDLKPEVRARAERDLVPL